jgi:hypothetical protein
MGTSQNRGQYAQLMLFRERVALLPQWLDLSEPKRAEVVRLLAQLLRDLHVRAKVRLSGGKCDE